MSDAHLLAIAEAQAAFRRGNDAIQASADSFTILHAIPFVCECPDEMCTEVVSLTFDQYEAIRQHPRRFFNVSGHERNSVDAGAERVIVISDTLTVVEKIGPAGDVVADAHTPRD